MRLIVECEHGFSTSHPRTCDCVGTHRFLGCPTVICTAQRHITDPDAILAALAEAGVLEVARFYDHLRYEWRLQYVSTPWKEAK